MLAAILSVLLIGSARVPTDEAIAFEVHANDADQSIAVEDDASFDDGAVEGGPAASARSSVMRPRMTRHPQEQAFLIRFSASVLLVGLVACLWVGSVAADTASLPEAPEVTVCGAIRERLAFWSWSSAAGDAQPERAARVPGAESLSHITRDGRTLRGYRLPSGAADGSTKRTLLVVGGNAMLADQILPELVMLTEAGLEVFVFDYRGYGQSEGKARLLAIIGDALEIAQRLAPEGGGEGEGPLAFYGISMGGIVLANNLPHLPPQMQPERFVIDGSPARIAQYGCPPTFDPVANLPADTSHILFVGGGLDVVVPLSESREMIEAIEEGGGTTVVRPDLAHPFQDRDFELHQERMRLIRDFLAG